jgi:anion-transporting  ArsA/GET3 family ATPase
VPLLSKPLASFLRRQLILVTGKGGVGKTLLTALLGEVLSDAGRRVLLVETDPRESLHQMTGIAPSGGEIVPVRAGLFLQNLQPRRVIEDLVRDRLHVEILVRRVLSSPVFDHFVEGAPGLKELAVLGHALRIVRGEMRRAPAVDMIVLDAPASGHAASLVTAPELISDVIREGPFGHIAADLSTFMADAERTGIVTVTRAEEMPVQEVFELRAALETRFGRGPELLVVNALLPPFPYAEVPSDPHTHRLLRLWKERRSVADRELQRLASNWQGDTVELPFVALERGPSLVAALRPAFEARGD